ncbi:MAG: NAD-binding protein [Myxococcota bacterium]
MSVHHHHRHLLLDLLRERLFKAALLFVGTWLVGGVGFWIIGRIYNVNDQLLLPDGTLDHTNFGILNCLYLAAMAISTLGFADMGMLNRVPGAGRDVIYMYLMTYALSAYIVVVYASAQIVSYVVEGALGKYLEKRRMERDLSEAAGHYVVCGLGMTGQNVVSELVKADRPVVGMDTNEERVAQLKALFPDGLFFVGDATEDQTLSHAGLPRAAGLFCTLPSDKDNIIIALSARQARPELRIVARATALQNLDKFRQVGANATISPNHIGGMRMASEMLRPAAVKFLDTFLRSQDEKRLHFESVRVDPASPCAGKRLAELRIHENLGLVVVATLSAQGSFRYNPPPETVVSGGDSVVVMVDPDGRAALERYLAQPPNEQQSPSESRPARVA